MGARLVKQRLLVRIFLIFLCGHIKKKKKSVKSYKRVVLIINYITIRFKLI
jgi:hypothetical protein